MQPQSLPRPSDKWIPYYFFAFFIALVLVLVPMCVIAVRTNTGVVTEHAYEKGLAYNHAIENAEKQKALNWRGQLSLAPEADHVKADFVLADAAGHPLKNADVTLWFVRPMQSGLEQKVMMQAGAAGHYGAQVTLPVHGLWEARVSAMVGDQNFQTVQRITLP